MSHARYSRYSSRSPSPYHRVRRSRSLSRSPLRSRSRSRSSDYADTVNPGNNLYVTGLSSYISKADLDEHFSKEGKVVDIHLVADPYTRESRGFGFVTMDSVKEAERCIKCLNGSILDGRVITVEKAKRGRGRTPTPGRYLGLRKIPARRRSPSHTPPYRRSRYNSCSDGEGSYSPDYEYKRRRSPSPYRRGYRRSPMKRRRYNESSLESSSPSPSISPHRYASRSPSPRMRQSRWRSYSRSISPYYDGRRRGYGRSYSRSISPRQPRSSTKRRRHSSSVSLSPIRNRRYRRSSISHTRRASRESYSHSRSLSSSSPSLYSD